MAKVNQNDLEATVMAAREKLMEYFKGTCIERFIENSPIELRGASRSTNYLYQRREQEIARPQTVFLGGLPIATVQHSPEKLVLHTKVLNRSPQFREIKKSLLDFMDKYLSGVEIEQSDKEVFYA